MKTPITLERLREYIVYNDLTHYDTIVLHPEDYGSVLNEFFTENDFAIYRSLEILGTKVVEDGDSYIKRSDFSVYSPVA